MHSSTLLRRVGALIFTLVVVFAVAPAARGAEGDVTVQSCIVAGTVDGCGSDSLLDGAYGVALSPDGKFAYFTTHDSNAIVGHTIDSATGALTRIPGVDGCVREVPVDTNLDTVEIEPDCQDGRGLVLITDIVISPDGEFAYAAGFFSGAIAVFERNTQTGVLTQKAGTAGCVSGSGDGGECADARALGFPVGLELSPDGANLYALTEGGSIAVFDRDEDTGVITQKANEPGCVNNDGSEDCAEGRALGGFVSQLAISEDGRHLYAPARGEGGMLLFNRDTLNGEIVQKSGTGGCITVDGSPDAAAVNQCIDGNDALADARSVVIAPGGVQVYVLTNTGVVSYTRNSDGTLTQLGCMTEDSLPVGCEDGLEVNNLWAGAFSPDGQVLAVTDFGSEDDSVAGTGVRFFNRGSNGSLSQSSTQARCITTDGVGGGVAGACAAHPAMGSYGLIRWAPDNRHLYAGQNAQSAAVVMERDFGPTCSPRSVTTPFNTSVSVSLQCSDANGDPITLQISRQPTNGGLAAIDQANDSVRYNPFAGFSGQDSFGYQAVANGVTSSEANVAVTVDAPPPTPPPPPPPLPPVDNDRDGSSPPDDCDDNNAGIRRGIPEIAGNDVDENCDSVKELGRITSGVDFLFNAKSRFTTVTRLTATNLIPGSTVELICRARRGCPFRRKKVSFSRATNRRSLARFFSKRQRVRVRGRRRTRRVKSKIAVRGKIEVRITAPFHIGKVVTFRIRRKRIPSFKVTCLPPGSKRPQRTC